MADIKHDHRTADGELIRPIIEIAGYPAPKEIAPPTPALRSIEARPLLSAAIGTRPSRKAAGANGLDGLGLMGQPNNCEAEEIAVYNCATKEQ